MGKRLDTKEKPRDRIVTGGHDSNRFSEKTDGMHGMHEASNAIAHASVASKLVCMVTI